MRITEPAGRSHAWISLLLVVAMAATVGTALGFQYIGGYIPCKLCLEQRIPYYAALPIMLVAVLSGFAGWPFLLTRMMLIVGGLLMTYGMGLAIYHSGVEWGFWPGPTDCAAAATSITTRATDLLSAIDATRPPSCDQAAGRFLGLSFAGWNAIASLVLAAIALVAAFTRTINIWPVQGSSSTSQ